jgi:Cof subfamily protein (haloacid dehalogenase superfamily)
MARIQLLAFDVDGTLLDSSHQLRERVAEALDRLSMAQVTIVLATARSPKALGSIVSRLSFSPWLICFSGGWIGQLDPQSHVPTKVVLDKRLTPSAARVIVTAASAYHIEPNVFTPTEWRVRALTSAIKAECGIVDSAPLIVSELLGEQAKPSKIMLITNENESTDPLQKIAHLVKPLSTTTFSKPNYLEIIPAGVNKAKALAQIGQELGINLGQVAAVGDGLNDIEMLKEAAIGIAMGNASQSVKSAADWITGTNDEEGVAQAVQRLIDEGLV